ncbi:hypothetical protein DFH09DRAFT_1414837, partial [Mycena vulgaris]
PFAHSCGGCPYINQPLKRGEVGLTGALHLLSFGVPMRPASRALKNHFTCGHGPQSQGTYLSTVDLHRPEPHQSRAGKKLERADLTRASILVSSCCSNGVDKSRSRKISTSIRVISGPQTSVVFSDRGRERKYRTYKARSLAKYSSLWRFLTRALCFAKTLSSRPTTSDFHIRRGSARAPSRPTGSVRTMISGEDLAQVVSPAENGGKYACQRREGLRVTEVGMGSAGEEDGADEVGIWVEGNI